MYSNYIEIYNVIFELHTLTVELCTVIFELIYTVIVELHTSIVVGDFGEDQLVHQVVETILATTATKATEKPPSHEPDSVATSNSSKYLQDFLCGVYEFYCYISKFP